MGGGKKVSFPETLSSNKQLLRKNFIANILNIKMKFVIAFLFALISLALAQTPCVRDDSDGRPACNAAEMTQRFWRNNWDPTAYWVCETLNTAATAVRCPTEGMFSTAALSCINWADWEWTPTCMPPSKVTM